MTGKSILHYNILEKLGEGGMGVVYKAEDSKLKRTVALKFLPGYKSASEEDHQRFKNEARAAASLNHPNISTIYSIEENDDEAFIAMEFIDGKDIKSCIPKVLLQQNPDQFNNYILQISEGLEAAHKRNIIHRDIKPQNIMITKDGHVKIMDFGVAKLSNANITKVNLTVGTLAYISPEQLQGKQIDYRSDIWSFGVVLYELITGTIPFHGDYEAAIIYSILNEEPKAINSFLPDVPDNLASLVSLMLQKDPDKRISSYKELKNILKKNIPATEKSEAGPQSIAVLYFENMSPEKENEYFCAGITEDLIIDLSRIKDLKVIPRSDVLPFRNKEVNTKKIGELLKVPFILEGSVRKAGQKIRISAELIDVNSGFPVWAERYDRSMEDIFEIQLEVSQKIAEALKVSLTETEKKLLGEKPTDDMRAYDFYLRGRELISKYGKRNNEAAIQMFEYALTIDPGFALAYAGLAEAYSYQFIWYDGNMKYLAKIITAGEKALKLDPDSVEVQFVMGMVYQHQKRYKEAIKVYEDIISKDKNFYQAYRWCGIVYFILGDNDTAIDKFKKAASIKPYSEEPLMQMEMAYRKKGDDEETKRVREKFMEVAHAKLELDPDNGVTLSRVAGVYAADGDKEKAIASIKRVLEIDPDDGLAVYNCACVYARLNMKKESLECLIKVFNKGYKNVTDWVNSDPDFDNLRDDPEFRKIVD